MKNDNRCNINYPAVYKPGVYLPNYFMCLPAVKTNEHVAFCWHAIKNKISALTQTKS